MIQFRYTNYLFLCETIPFRQNGINGTEAVDRQSKYGIRNIRFFLLSAPISFFLLHIQILTVLYLI